MEKGIATAEATYTERDGDEIAAEVYREMDATEKGNSETSKSSSTPPKDDEKTGEPKEASDEQAQGGEKDGQAAEGEKEGADKEAASGGENGDKQGEKGTEGSQGEGDLDKKITDHAQKHGMTYAEAKEDIEKTAEIINQYKNDPAEMARAMRNKDREYNKLKTEAEKAAAQKQPLFRRMTDDQFRVWAREQVKGKADMITKYREKYPAKSEGMSDEAVVEEIAERELEIYRHKADEKEAEIRTLAIRKRDELLSSVSEADRRFIPEVKAILSETHDSVVLNGDFDVQDAIYWAKGKVFDKEIKDAEERGAKREREKAAIVGVKKAGTGSSKASTGSKETALTSKQKGYAKEMFGADYDEEKCFQMFRDTFAEQLKKDANYDPYKD